MDGSADPVSGDASTIGVMKVAAAASAAAQADTDTAPRARPSVFEHLGTPSRSRAGG